MLPHDELPRGPDLWRHLAAVMRSHGQERTPGQIETMAGTMAPRVRRAMRDLGEDDSVFSDEELYLSVLATLRFIDVLDTALPGLVDMSRDGVL